MSAAYHALMCRRLVALDKQPRVRPVAIGEIWHRCIAKGNLAGLGANAKRACGSLQLCAGLEAGIKGALHAVRLCAETNGLMLFCAREIDDDLWELKMEECEDPPWTAEAEGDQREECVDGPEWLTLVDARNGFNKLSRYAMLWTARHRWLKGTRFAFNCYRHYARCLVRCPGGESSILLSREGVTQGVLPVRNPIWTRTVAVGRVSPMRLQCQTAIKLHGAPAVVCQQPGNDRRK